MGFGVYRKLGGKFNCFSEYGVIGSLSPSFKPALFNRAPYLEAQHEWSKAEDAWKQYLATDPDSPWTVEARAHLDQVKQRLASSNGHD